MFDFAACGLAAQNRSIVRRLATLDTLARGIATNLPKGLPPVIAAPVAESLSSTTTIAGGLLYGFNSGTPASDFRHHYGLFGGEWLFNGTQDVQAVSYHAGNGTDPTQSRGGRGVSVRFATHADVFEVYGRNTTNGFRMLVNGKLLKAGTYGNNNVNGASNLVSRYYKFDLTATEFAGTGLKNVEILADGVFYLWGVRVPTGHTVTPWGASPVKAALHGDSMPTTVSDGVNSIHTSQYGRMPELMRMLTGITNIWGNNASSVGFSADAGGTLSDFIEQATVDFTGAAFDLVWELGGRNDTPASLGAYQALVENWLQIVLADNPDAIVIMTGPIAMTTAEAASANFQTMQSAKKAVCAAHPRNCAFITNCGNATIADPWVFGSGTVSAAANNGNADLVRGTDGVHGSVLWHQYYSNRLAGETAKVLPLLASRVRDGVIAGVNDLDLL